MGQLTRRLEKLEKSLTREDILVIVIEGGLPDSDGSCAHVGEVTLHRRPEETVKAFHDRAVAVAEAAGVKIVIIGGLPQDD